MLEKVEPNIIIGNFVIEMLQRNINSASKEYLYSYIIEVNNIIGDKYFIMADDRHLFDFFTKKYLHIGRVISGSITLNAYPMEKAKFKFRSAISEDLADAFIEAGKIVFKNA
jgi:hypothetical protein